MASVSCRADSVPRLYPSIGLVGLILVALGGTMLSDVQDAHAASPSEYEVKAAFLYNFAKFIEWPDGAFADTSAPLVLGVLGADPFGIALKQTVQGKTIGGRSLVIQRSREIQHLEGCHLLFISSSEERRLGVFWRIWRIRVS